MFTFHVPEKSGFACVQDAIARQTSVAFVFMAVADGVWSHA